MCTLKNNGEYPQMKIVLYANSFLPNRGGGEYYNYDLANYLALKGESVYVITPIPGKDYIKFNFNVIRTDSRILRSLPEIISAIKAIKPDIVHISGPTPLDYVVLPLLKFLRIPSLMTYHADFPSRIGRALNYAMFIFQYCVEQILVQTDGDRKNL